MDNCLIQIKDVPFTPLCTVQDWLKILNTSELIFTDSFHCTAFSLNFNKEFFVFYPEKYSSRLESILKLTGTEWRAEIENVNDIKAINYKSVNEVLDRERSKATDFILSNCN